jgi:chaperonin cofactor prefoldin
VRELKNQITQKDISLTSVKSEVTAKLKEIQAFQSRVEELEQDVSLVQKKLSEMDSLKRHIMRIYDSAIFPVRRKVVEYGEVLSRVW